LLLANWNEDRSSSLEVLVFVQRVQMQARGHVGRFVLTSIVLGCAMSFSSVSRAQNPAGGSADKNTAATQARVLILLPRVKILKSTFSSSNESEGASEAVQAGFHGVLSRTFEDNGYTLRFDTTQMARWEETPKNDAAIKVLQDAYDSLFCPSAYSPPNCQKSGKPSLDLTYLTDSNEFDAVVLARARGFERTKTGRVGYSIDPRFSLDFSIAIVDMRTGLSLYSCQSTATGDYIGAPDSRLSGPVQSCLKQYFSRRPKHN
jgi:hypothetical protein